MALTKEEIKRKFNEILKKAEGLSNRLLGGGGDLLAVDMGSYAIKVVHIQKEGEAHVLKAWGHLPLNANPEIPPEEKKNQAVSLLGGFLAQKGINIQNTVTSIAGLTVLVRYPENVPTGSKNEVYGNLVAQLGDLIPYPIEETRWAFQIFGETNIGGQKKADLVLVAAKKEDVENRMEALREAGLQPMIVDVDAFALENVLEHLPAPPQGGGATLCLNIGHTVTNLSILENGVTRVVRDILVAGSSLTKSVMTAMRCNYEKAEGSKKTYSLIIGSEGKERALQTGRHEEFVISQALATVIKELMNEIHKSVEYYLSRGPERSIGRILLTGGTAGLKNLPQLLSEELKIPVSILNPLFFLKGAEEVPQDLAPSFAVVAGLGLRRLWDWQ